MISHQIGLLVMLNPTPKDKKKTPTHTNSHTPKQHQTNKPNQPPHHVYLGLYFYAKFNSLLWMIFHFSCLQISQKHLYTKLTIPLSMALTAHLIQRQNNKNFLILTNRLSYSCTGRAMEQQISVQSKNSGFFEESFPSTNRISKLCNKFSALYSTNLTVQTSSEISSVCCLPAKSWKHS